MLVVKSSTRTDITSFFRVPNLAKGIDSWQYIPHIYDVEEGEFQECSRMALWEEICFGNRAVGPSIILGFMD